MLYTNDFFGLPLEISIIGFFLNFFPSEIRLFLKLFEQFFIIFRHSFLTDPEEQDNHWVRTRAGLATYCCCQVPVFVSFHIPSTCYLFFFLLLFFPVFFQVPFFPFVILLFFFPGTCFFLFFFRPHYHHRLLLRHHHHQAPPPSI